MWNYQACVDRVVDGDTIELVLDLGFYTRKIDQVRLDGIDTHEIHRVSHDSEEFEQGMEEKRWVEEWVRVGEEEHDAYEWPFIVEVHGRDKYGRWIGSITRRGDRSDLAEALIERFGDEIVYD